jgi:hypothetical protein
MISMTEITTPNRYLRKGVFGTKLIYLQEQALVAGQKQSGQA